MLFGGDDTESIGGFGALAGDADDFAAPTGGIGGFVAVGAGGAAAAT